MDFPGNSEAKLGGLIPIFLHWSSEEWPISFLKIIGGEPLCDTMAFPNKQYYGYALVNRLFYNEQPRKTASGDIYAYSLTGFVKDRKELAPVLKYMMSKRHYVVCADHHDHARLFGVPGNLAQFEWEFASEEDGDKDPLVKFVFTWLTRDPAPYVNINVCGLTVPVSPLEEYVEDGYWQSQYTNP